MFTAPDGMRYPTGRVVGVFKTPRTAGNGAIRGGRVADCDQTGRNRPLKHAGLNKPAPGNEQNKSEPASVLSAESPEPTPAKKVYSPKKIFFAECIPPGPNPPRQERNGR